MKLINNFIINPNKYLLPSFLISPFSSKDITANKRLTKSLIAQKYLKNRFKKNFFYTLSGKKAINIALENCNLKKNDCVSIFTTSENFYISSCVTKEIEKFCYWSRKIEKNTKVIFINHEFGYPYQNIEKFKKYKVPIIEDYAHSFFLNEDKPIVGDFAIYSLPKMFPLQIGGILVSKKSVNPNFEIKKDIIKYIDNVLSYYLKKRKKIIKKRLNNFNYLVKEFKKIKLTPFFDNYLETPGVFMFKTPSKINLDEFKKYMNNNGIQSSVFYGEKAYFIPIHQNLTRTDLNYFFETVKNFFKK